MSDDAVIDTGWIVQFCKVSGISATGLCDLKIHDGSTVAHVFDGLFVWGEQGDVEKLRLSLGHFTPSFLGRDISLEIDGAALECEAAAEARTMLLGLVAALEAAP
tara:strand:+ start:380 stop:694 length:315 start_codon:yes stop_codon:yes gene_type:complete